MVKNDQGVRTVTAVHIRNIPGLIDPVLYSI
jgi:hypothetical protein